MRKQLPVLLMLLTFFCTASVTIAQTPTEGVAKNFLWYRLVSNSVKRSQTPQQVVASMDGNLFASNAFYSKERADASSVFNFDASSDDDKAISYGDDGSATNGNTALTIYKMTPEGKLLWHIYNSRGEVANNVNCITATPDGGFVTILMVRDAQAKSKKEVDILRLVQADGKPYDIEMKSLFVGVGDDTSAGATRRKIMPILIKVSAAGQIEYHKAFEVDHKPMPDATRYNYGTPTGCDFKGTTIDPEGNIYVCGFVRTAITIGKMTIKAKNNVKWNGDSQKQMGDFFILKFDSKGNLVKTLTEKGDPIGHSMLGVIKYQDGKLYAAGRFTGTKEKTPITINGKQLIPSDKGSLVTLCLDTDLKVSWISQIDVKTVPEHTMKLAFVDGIAVGKDKVYIAGRCAGALVDAEGNVILEQKLRQHRGYALALDKATGKPNAEWHTLLPEKGISNCTAISTQGDRVILHAYAMGAQTYYRVLDLNLSKASVQDYPMVSKAMTSFGGDIVANSYVAAVRCQNDADLLTTSGYKKLECYKWFSLFVAHKLPFPSVSASCKALHLSEGKGTLQVLASDLKDPIQVTCSGEGFTAKLKELPATGGALEIQFKTAVTKTPEERIGKLTLTSGGASYEVYLYAMTETEQYIKASQSEINFSMIPVGEHKSVDLIVTQKNLMSAITCTIEGEGAKYYSVDKSEIAISNEPATLKVTYTPDKTIAANAKATAQLVLTSGNVKTIVTLSGQTNTAVEEVAATKLSIATAAGTLYVHSDVARPVAIYTSAGEMVAQQLLSGDMEIALPTGVYFIQTARETYRVYIPAI
ncbi:hypothetical protein [Porphyromonas uenonis]|uniref:hypothetical protein n=1 Tax=Porphyromonas uenonis TaxID=281920 RepID=UPI0026F233F3|nr:hypothetical protein [Porphyromonas uenonis]